MTGSQCSVLVNPGGAAQHRQVVALFGQQDFLAAVAPKNLDPRTPRTPRPGEFVALDAQADLEHRGGDQIGAGGFVAGGGSSVLRPAGGRQRAWPA